MNKYTIHEQYQENDTISFDDIDTLIDLCEAAQEREEIERLQEEIERELN